MDHVDLKAYPFPEGVHIPRLMPFQEFPWNGDGYLAAEVLRMKEAHGLTCALETGTCLGSSTLWLWENFKHTWTFELHRPYFDIAVGRMVEVVGRHIKEDIGTRDVWIGGHGHEGQPNSILAINTSSPDGINTRTDAISSKDNRPFIFLDAHWTDNCPLLAELEAIAKAEIAPCIVIHDFFVPGTDFGFDKMPDGKPFNLDLIYEHLNAIYGEGGWVHNYPTQVEGARRGWISIAPASKD